MNSKEQLVQAFAEGYLCFEQRRGINPYPVHRPEWLEYERGWCAAFVFGAADKSTELMQERLAKRDPFWEGNQYMDARNKAYQAALEEKGIPCTKNT